MLLKKITKKKKQRIKFPKHNFSCLWAAYFLQNRKKRWGRGDAKVKLETATATLVLPLLSVPFLSLALKEGAWK